MHWSALLHINLTCPSFVGLHSNKVVVVVVVVTGVVVLVLVVLVRVVLVVELVVLVQVVLVTVVSVVVVPVELEDGGTPPSSPLWMIRAVHVLKSNWITSRGTVVTVRVVVVPVDVVVGVVGVVGVLLPVQLEK